MPELPEVETTRRGITPWCVGQKVTRVDVRERRLRWPVPAEIVESLPRQTIRSVDRRAKYLLIRADRGTVIAHLGMSGSLRVTRPKVPPRKHDHLDIVLANGMCLRFHDPRRFGCVLWTTDDPCVHPLLRDLGPEPWDADSEYIYRRSRGRNQSVKGFLMDSHTLVGVGNIYANEALFLASIDPRRAAGSISRARYQRLATAIVRVLDEALGMGGTTLRDFVSASGEPGYFRQVLRVYDRDGEPCRRCSTKIRRILTGQRSTYFCPRCQH
ncbi:MAG: bifunctional DNA-formamidopyrimidine glycosylase/DNA-(apurinic or apyrimidinic site) lyase [Chromatiales bacterium]